MKQKHKNKISDNEIIKCYNENLTLHETAVKLNMTVVTLWRRAKKINLKWSDKIREPTNKIMLEDILKGDYPQYQTFKLKKRLLKENIFINKCFECNITEWNNMPINMQLDHIDGNSHNHKLDNLRLLCPNCHSQTDTYCGKNKL